MYKYTVVIDCGSVPEIHHIETFIKVPTGWYSEGDKLHPSVLKIFDIFQIDNFYDENTGQHSLYEDCYVCIEEFDEFKTITNL